MDEKLKRENMQKRAVFWIFWEQSGQVCVENGAMLTTYLFRYIVGSWAARSPVCPLILAYEIPRFFPFAETVCVSVRKNSVDVSTDKKW